MEIKETLKRPAEILDYAVVLLKKYGIKATPDRKDMKLIIDKPEQLDRAWEDFVHDMYKVISDDWDLSWDQDNDSKEIILSQYQNVIEIKEEVQIGDIILEKGDRIKVITESSNWDVTFKLVGSIKPLYDDSLKSLLTKIMMEFNSDEIDQLISDGASIGIIVGSEMMAYIDLKDLLR